MPVGMAKRGEGMTRDERNNLLYAAATRYVAEKNNSAVWARESSDSLALARGYLDGICTALRLDYEVQTCIIDGVTYADGMRFTSSKGKKEILCVSGYGQ